MTTYTGCIAVGDSPTVGLIYRSNAPAKNNASVFTGHNLPFTGITLPQSLLAIAISVTTSLLCGIIHQQYERKRIRKGRSHVWTGLFIIAVGAALFLKASGIFFPRWFFTWPVLLIAFGFFAGIRDGFRHIGWLIPVAIGGIFLADEVMPGF